MIAEALAKRPANLPPPPATSAAPKMPPPPPSQHQPLPGPPRPMNPPVFFPPPGGPGALPPPPIPGQLPPPPQMPLPFPPPIPRPAMPGPPPPLQPGLPPPPRPMAVPVNPLPPPSSGLPPPSSAPPPLPTAVPEKRPRPVGSPPPPAATCWPHSLPQSLCLCLCLCLSLSLCLCLSLSLLYFCQGSNFPIGTLGMSAEPLLLSLPHAVRSFCVLTLCPLSASSPGLRATPRGRGFVRECWPSKGDSRYGCMGSSEMDHGRNERILQRRGQWDIVARNEGNRESGGCEGTKREGMGRLTEIHVRWEEGAKGRRMDEDGGRRTERGLRCDDCEVGEGSSVMAALTPSLPLTVTPLTPPHPQPTPPPPPTPRLRRAHRSGWPFPM